MTVDELHGKMTEEFKAVRAELNAAIKSEQTDTRNYIDAAVRAEGERTRRHFDVVAEQFKEYTKVLADGTARNTEASTITRNGSAPLKEAVRKKPYGLDRRGKGVSIGTRLA
jgi:hypothetical protein